jgi:SAM-dependent methyltransferase
MRDVKKGFYLDVLGCLIEDGTISVSDSILVVCGGPLDQEVMGIVGFTDVTNLDTDIRQDAENLTYDNRSFDVVIVHAGLHHCHSPHRALLEMYRVARKCAVAFEARDSLMMRAARRMGLTLDYELHAITPEGTGGVANTGIPNFIYRWTERGVKNVIASYDPARSPQIKFFYDLRIPIQRLKDSRSVALLAIASMIEPLSKALARIAPKQCNEFAFAIMKSGAVHRWIRLPDSEPLPR